MVVSSITISTRCLELMICEFLCSYFPQTFQKQHFIRYSRVSDMPNFDISFSTLLYTASCETRSRDSVGFYTKSLSDILKNPNNNDSHPVNMIWKFFHALISHTYHGGEYHHHQLQRPYSFGIHKSCGSVYVASVPQTPEQLVWVS